MKINYRQLSVMVFMSFIAVKFLALPSLLYTKSENMSWLVALVLMIIDGIYALIILDLINKNQDKNLYEFMKNTVGTVLAKIFLVVLVCKFTLIITNIGKGLEFFVVENLYTEFDWFLFTIPLLMIVGFMAYKGIRNIARVFEMIIFPVVVGIVYIGIKALGGVEVLTFFPFFKNGVMPLLDSAYVHLGWFGSSVFMLMLFGKIDFRNKKKYHILVGIFGSIILVMFIYFVFYGIFSKTSATHNFCLSDVSQFTTETSAINELSWLVVAMWIIAQVVQFAMYSYCLSEALRYLFGIKSNIIPIILIEVYILLWGYFGKKDVNSEQILYSDFSSIITIVAEYIIPLVLLVGYWVNFIHQKKLKKEGVENAQT